jgi:hypothetical protein
MSKYINEVYLRSLQFTDSEWKEFLNMIQIDCHFKGSNILSGAGVTRRKISLDDIKVRYYTILNTNHYHVSNDDRRKIVKFLRSTPATLAETSRT